MTTTTDTIIANAVKRGIANARKPKQTADQIRQTIVTDMLAALDKGIVPWQRPWQTLGMGHPANIYGRPYRGINVLILGITAMKHGYTDHRWVTWKGLRKVYGIEKSGRRYLKDGKPIRSAEIQAACLKDGESFNTRTTVVLWKFVPKKDENGERIGSIPLLRTFEVWNADQIRDEVIPPLEQDTEAAGADPVEAADAIIDGYLLDNGPKLAHDGGDGAFYRPSTDSVHLPKPEQFHSTGGYYSTAFHELTHSTGHEKRLNRFKRSKGFGSAEYSEEELVAEMGAAFLLGMAGMEVDYENSASYIDGWRKKLTRDPKLIFDAAAKANKATDLIVGQEYDADSGEWVSTRTEEQQRAA